ncbi:MAG TPA: hypothetical protein VGP70_21945 [Actinomadura sp.]|nr:hypothetical protein [Actinomadura sp.]
MSQGRALRPIRVHGATMVLRAGTGAWTAVPAGVAEPQSLLNDVTALSAAEAWAVGQTQDHPLVAHWTGSGWTSEPAPRPPGAVGAGLLGVDSAGPRAAIAVGGAYDRLTGTEIPLVRHWDGSGWATAGLDGGHVLTAVAMLSATEAWAVGHGRGAGNGSSGPVALHWIRGEWTRAAVPPVARGRLLAVAGSSPEDVWAVGAAGREGLILHYDGRMWSRTPSPAGRPLTDVVALSPDRAWAVDGSGPLSWNGVGWRRAEAPPITSANTLSALARSDIWVGGGRGELAHFDGRTWSRVGSPPPLDDTAVWLGSASAGPGTVWMVGSQRCGDVPVPAPRPTVTADSGDA